jgi:hypothetical protein
MSRQGSDLLEIGARSGAYRSRMTTVVMVLGLVSLGSLWLPWICLTCWEANLIVRGTVAHPSQLAGERFNRVAPRPFTPGSGVIILKYVRQLADDDD